MKFHNFESCIEALLFVADQTGYDNYLPGSCEDLSELTRAQKDSLSQSGHWLIEVVFEYYPLSTDPCCLGERLSPRLTSRFYGESIQLMKELKGIEVINEDQELNEVVTVKGCKVFQLVEDDPVVILDSLTPKNPLSSQLRSLTGCSYNAFDFCDVHDPSSLTPSFIEHKATGVKYLVPNQPFDDLKDITMR